MSNQKTARKKSKIAKMRRRRTRSTFLLLGMLIVILALGGTAVYLLRENGAGDLTAVYDFDSEFPAATAVSEKQIADSFASNLCVGEDGVVLSNVSIPESQAGALFDLTQESVLYSQGMYNRVYPASITKIMTAMIALENGNLDDTVTISKSAITLEEGSQVAGFAEGDRVTLDQLLHVLLVYSGNDAAAAISEYIGGTEDQFVQMMNDKAASLGCTGTHFTNPHGLQDENHYTTPYDIYLMLKEAMNYKEFVDIIQLGSYTVHYEGSDGTEKLTNLEATDHYLTGETTAPKNVTVLGGKTGTTSLAGNCLAIISQNAYGNPFVSIVMNAQTKELLYEQMNSLLANINS